MKALLKTAHRAGFVLGVFLLGSASLGAGKTAAPPVVAPLAAYQGPSVKGVDTGTLTGRVMCGYQGWFNCEGDGAGLGWTHWAQFRSKPFGPGNVCVDMWPDVSELSAPERYATPFVTADGNPAELFSSYCRETVLRHFRWMREYGIDGVFVQRFADGLKNPIGRQHKDVVLAKCREGANREGRAYAVMYDLSGLPAGGVAPVLEDWRRLRSQMQIGKDPAYLQHNGKPLVAVWGVGFGSDRLYSLAECRTLIEGLREDGCSVMLGIPSGWREQKRDATNDSALHEVLKLADILSPWTPGRYRSVPEVARHAETGWKPDIRWCAEAGIEYLPVVFPGFSWHNKTPDAPSNQIPRLKGSFLWSQFAAAKSAGAKMVYVAMFDEVDEGTAIFKITDQPPVGANPFVGMEGLPSDHYLWLTGEAARQFRGAAPLSSQPPPRAEPQTVKTR